MANPPTLCRLDSRPASICSAVLALLAIFLGHNTRVIAQGYAPDQAAAHMTVADGFEVQLVAAEPLVRQPVAIEFDDRGRLWVVQYLQYPNPAGLARVKVDRYSRTIYDRVPEPPPRGTRGEDRITILTDTDGDGRADSAKDFVAGLNLASGLAFGHGGVFVLNAPYLLFYPDRNRDDVPDADPEVLLTGFGMEDAHSVANSLTWGPDGWLYGTQGSTVTANIRGVEFQQGVWRYHPQRKVFELFCEGGGNSWGLDFDPRGELLYSTNLGGHVMLHGLPGAYYWKSFGKHGALHNPYAYGYFDHVPHADFTGGHVTVGGQLYQGNLFPAEFRGRYIAGDLLGHAVRWHTVTPRGTTFSSANGGVLLEANDTWFAPSDVTIGPDGAVYVADWHDARTAHPDPDASWDRRNGRIYRIQPRGAVRPSVRDLRDASDDELIAALAATNAWYARRARLELSARANLPHHEEVRSRLVKLANSASGSADREAGNDVALSALWALAGRDEVDTPRATELLKSHPPEIRAWRVRLAGEQEAVPPSLAAEFRRLAIEDPSAIVRRQLASTARRLPAQDCLKIATALAKHDCDADDPCLPLLIWWALEEAYRATPGDVLATWNKPELWERPLARAAILPRLARRCAAAGDFDGCLQLVHSAGTEVNRHVLFTAIEEGLRGRTDASPAPAALIAIVETDWRRTPADAALARLAIRLGVADAEKTVLAQCLDSAVADSARLAALEILADLGSGENAVRLLPLIEADVSPSLKTAALRALARASDPAVAARLLALYPQLSDELKAQLRDTLLGKARWAADFLSAVDRGEIDSREVPVEQLRSVAAHASPALDELVRRHWGAIHAATAEERLAVARRLNNDLRAAPGNPEPGHAVFRKQCGTCHQLFGEGATIGPELTHANRKDRQFVLNSIVDPSAVIRKEFAGFNVQMHDGRIHAGLIVAQDAGQITLLTAKNERINLNRAEISTIDESPQSLMPENLADQLSPQELRDLFAWLEQPGPAANNVEKVTQ